MRFTVLCGWGGSGGVCIACVQHADILATPGEMWDGHGGGKAGWRTRRTGNRNFQKGVWHPQNTGGHHRQPRGTFVGPPILDGGWVGSFLARFGPSKYRVLVPGVACRVQRMYIIYARERPQRAKRGVCILSSGCMCPCLHTCACVVQPRHVRVRVVQPHAPPPSRNKMLKPRGDWTHFWIDVYLPSLNLSVKLD